VDEHRERISALGSEFGVVNIRMFGSVARGDDDYRSDVDLLVDLLPSDVPFRLAAFKDEIERMLGVDVDVVVDADGRPGIEHIRQTAVAV
jgi:predicted nucleotidyltransferase